MPRERERIAQVALFHPGDTTTNPGLDRLTRLAADLFDAPIAAVSLLDGQHQWLKSRCGLGITVAPREHSFCDHILRVGPGGVVVVPDATRDTRFASNPAVTGDPGVRFYVGAALTSPAGYVLGALCVADTKPRDAPELRMIARLRMLAEAVTDQLELERVMRHQLEQMQLLEMAESVSGAGHWRLDLATKNVQWSRQVYAIHGISPGDFDPNLDSAIDFYHPEDQPKVRASLDAVLASESPVGFQLQLRRRDGDLRTVVSRSLCQRDGSGAPVAVFGVFQDITEHTRALATAQRNEARYRLLADNMADVVTRILPDGASNYISPAIQRLLGYRPQEMAGRSALDFVHPDDHAGVLAAFAELASGGEQRTLEIRAIHKNGSHLWVETSFQSVANDQSGFEIVAVIRDISERRKLQATAADRERLYQLLADNSTDLINRSNLNCDILYASPAALQLTGYSPAELIGRKTTDLIHPEDWPQVRRAYAKLVHFGREARVESITYRMVRKDGTLVWVEVSPKVVWDGKRPIEFVDVVRNITARKAAEAELVKARKAAEAASEAKAQFLANMSHELRTPLTSILGFSRLLSEQAELSDLSRRCLGHVDIAGRALLSTVNDVLDLSQLEAGQISILPVPTEVRDFFQTTLDLLSPQASAKDISLRLEIDDIVPPIVAIDPDRVRQVLLNLLGNAVKFTAVGSVVLSVFYEPQDARLIFAVADTGPGIAADRLDLLFQRFSQLDDGIARAHGGTGLGLAICKGLVEAMGGHVGVSSIVGVGSRFSCMIEASATTLDLHKHAFQQSSEVRGLRVLIVDDHLRNRELVRFVLEASGCATAEAPDGMEALRLAAATPFDAILLDLRMPGLGGIETLGAIRNSGGPNDMTPILAFTATVEADEGQLRAAGFDGLVTKPLQPGKLVQALRSVTEAAVYARAS